MIEGIPNGYCDPFGVVADACGAEDVDAVFTEDTGDIARVCVDDFAEEDFCSDGDDFCGWHGSPV